MTKADVFIDLDTLSVRGSMTGSAGPAIIVAFNTVLECRVGFLRAGVCVALNDDTPVTMTLKKQLDHTGAAIGLDIDADETGDGEDRRYKLKSTITGADLATALTGKDAEKFTLQFSWGTEGEDDYGLSLPMTVVIINSYVRDGDALPSPLASAGWTYLKAHITGGVVDEDAKTIDVGAPENLGGYALAAGDDGRVMVTLNGTPVGYLQLLELDS